MKARGFSRSRARTRGSVSDAPSIWRPSPYAKLLKNVNRRTLPNPARANSRPAPTDLGGPLMPNVLSSWKEIAAYVGRSIRTVQRWERELGLPVHRPNGKTDGVVIALPAELDAWVKAMPTTSHFLNAEDGNGVHAAVHSDGNGNGNGKAN